MKPFGPASPPASRHTRALCAAGIATLWCLLGLAPASGTAEVRVFRNKEGKEVRASFEGLSGESVTLKREDGKVFVLPKDSFSLEDQFFFSQSVASSGGEAKKLNAAAGHALSNGEALASRKAEEIAKALQLRPESKSKYGKSWRLYAATANNYRLFGAMPYSVALYSDQDGLVTSLSIVYANKGDFGSKAGFGEDHFEGGTTATAKSLGEAMAKDDETVTKALTAVLGAGKTERYGEGSTRRKITRWDWNGHSFILSNEEDEYVSLGIVPTTVADAGGRTSLTKDAEVKQRLLASVVKSANGDVYLSEIPMVDQGPKGYCVPATFERVMRTMGLEADMYLLAMVGQSGMGGGTSVELLLENLRHQVLRKGRRIKEEQVKELRIRDLKRYLDQGIPVMWTLCSMPKYNEAAEHDTNGRPEVKDWQARAAEIAEISAPFAKMEKPSSNYHICMITGYNEVTQELAVSDSWGPRFERRWVPLAVANWASMGKVVMIRP